jgi:chromosome segregation ATPase
VALALVVAILATSSVEGIPLPHEGDHAALDVPADSLVQTLAEEKPEGKGAASAMDADAAGARVAEQVAKAKQSSMNNEQQLQQISLDAAKESKTAKAIEAQLNEAEKLTQQKMKVEKAIVDIKTSNALASTIDKTAKQSSAHVEKLNALKATIEQHQASLKKLHSNLKALNDDKRKAQIEALQAQLHKLQLQKGTEEAKFLNKNSTLHVLQHSQAIADAQTEKNKATTSKLTEQAKRLAGELEVMKDTAKQQESHLDKVEQAAQLNTKVQHQSMEQIRDKFDKEKGTLEDKIYAMKQSLALKKAHLKQLTKEATDAHKTETARAAGLDRLGYSIKKDAAKNKLSAKRYQEKEDEANDELEEMRQENAKVTSEKLMADSKVSLAKKKTQAVDAVQGAASMNATAGVAAADAALEEAHAKIKEVSKEKAEASAQISHAEVHAMQLVKDVAHAKILAAPEHKKAAALKKLLKKQEKENAEETTNLKHWENQTQVLGPKIQKLLSQKQTLQMKLPEVQGELEAVKASVTRKEEDKREAKLQNLEAVERHKEASKRFEKMAPQAVLLQKKIDAATQATQQAEDDISDVKADVEVATGQFQDKMEQLRESLKDSASQAEEDESNSHTLGKAHAAIVAEIATVQHKLANSHLTEAKQQQEVKDALDETTSEVAEVGTEFSEVKTAAMHSKQALEMFLNNSAKEAQVVAQKDTAVEERLLEEAAKAENEFAVSQNNLDTVKEQVGQHMKRTIGRETKMQKLRESGIEKMASYAKNVIHRLKGALASDDAQNGELKQEISHLDREVAAIRAQDATESQAEKDMEDQVKALQNKELDVAAKTKEAIASEVQKIMTVEGGKVDAEQQQEAAALTKEKLEVAHLAQEIKASEAQRRNTTASITGSQDEAERLRQQRIAMREKLQKYSDGVEAEHGELSQEAAKNKELQSELAALEQEGNRKKQKLELIISEQGVDAKKVDEMTREILDNRKKIKALQKKLGIDDLTVTHDTEELAKLAAELDGLNSGISSAQERQMTDEEKLKLDALKLRDEQDSLSKDSANAAALASANAALQSQLNAANATELSKEEQEAADRERLANMSAEERAAHEKATQEKLKLEKDEGDLSDEKDTLRATQLQEENAAKDAATNSAEADSLKDQLATLSQEETTKAAGVKSAEEAEKAREEALGVAGVSQDELRQQLADADAKVSADEEELSHDKSVLRKVDDTLKGDEHSLNVEQTADDTEKGTLKEQLASVSSMVASHEDQEQLVQGQLNAMLSEQSKFKGQTLKNSVFVAQDKEALTAAEADKRSAQAADADLKDQLSEVDSKLQSDMAADQKDQGEMAKTNAVNAALQQSILKEGMLANQTQAEIAQVQAEEAAAADKKNQLEGSLSAEQAALQALRANETAEDAALRSGQNSLNAARSQMSGSVNALESAIKNEKGEVKDDAAALAKATRAKNIAQMSDGELKAEYAGKQELVKTVGQNLDDLNSQLADATSKLALAVQGTKDAQAKVDETKAEAGDSQRKTEDKRADLNRLHQSMNQKKVEADAEVASIKARIADEQEKKTKAEADIATIHRTIKIMDQENNDSKTNTAKLEAEVFTKEKSVAELKKKESILKAFLSGPLLDVEHLDTDEAAGSGDEEVSGDDEYSEEVSSDEEDPDSSTTLRESRDSPSTPHFEGDISLPNLPALPPL